MSLGGFRSQTQGCPFGMYGTFGRRNPSISLPKGAGNCTGCFLKSEAQLAALARDEPDQHDWWERMEALASSLASSGVARFRAEYSRQTLREMVERQGDWIFDMEGALCQANWGECNG